MTPTFGVVGLGRMAQALLFPLLEAGLVEPDAVRAVRYLWPTPQASDNRDRGNLSTPAIQRRIRLGKQANLSMVVSHESGRLNPTWVEWLMGFPEGWTDCGR